MSMYAYSLYANVFFYTYTLAYVHIYTCTCVEECSQPGYHCEPHHGRLRHLRPFRGGSLGSLPSRSTELQPRERPPPPRNSTRWKDTQPRARPQRRSRAACDGWCPRKRCLPAGRGGDGRLEQMKADAKRLMARIQTMQVHRKSASTAHEAALGEARKNVPAATIRNPSVVQALLLCSHRIPRNLKICRSYIYIYIYICTYLVNAPS